jgi:DNA-binding response OmpR family regulator
MLTASREEALLQTALDIGVVDVLCKPVNLDQLALAVTVKLAMQD